MVNTPQWSNQPTGQPLASRPSSMARENLTWAIVQGLQQLPEPERTVFILSHYQGYRLDEIARLHQMDLREVEHLHEAARQRLLDSLDHNLACVGRSQMRTALTENRCVAAC
jgi:DNA-directed RNA polymerase specialized sigma24 family protein